ncbi:TlpA disulfide reductase family protein [Tamlana sp. 2_MG-2023]|uniref:TlpA family protein disulfide reductase n=1 Tax=unclassified Tamlana TaxID=2614803 RepID=UPI0026E222F5|nr:MULTISPECIES: TlpA disulfide reductase family protein [unclassified Tamlana]MDO6759078.1 TlpA disulfide reductase family protein [Tamlana sp. 2_MG-2023]MDO6789777.1 TlpA disulfide reductase family protein [Tamlana sp. 1_MG-2023]
MKSNLSLKNMFFVVVIILLIIPQTRQPIQIWINKGLALFSPSTTAKENQHVLTDYNWLLKTKSGELINLEASKGKVILINFWGTWCPPCIAEMPSMQALYEDYKDKVEFVFISDEDHSLTNTFLEEKGYTFETFVPRTAHPKIFNVTSIPRTFLIDKSGHVIIDKTGAANWDSKEVRKTIDELLAVDL